MARNEIIQSSTPRGVFLEGTLEGALKPGTCVQVKAAVEPINGEYTWQVWDGAADGEQDLVAVLLPDSLLGKTATDAYADGDHCYLYMPVRGEFMNMLVANIAGTADTHAIGEKLMIDKGTGKLIATTGSPEMEPFKCMETKAALTADALVLTQCIQ